MMKTPILYLATLFLLTGLVISCGSSTDIMAVWRSPEVKSGQYKNICIAAITENATNKQVVEQEMHNQLQKKGVNSTRIVDLLPYKFTGTPNEKDLILEKVRTNGNDAIITFALIKQKEETRYVPGTVYAPPASYGYYGTFGGYYGYYGTRMYDPGYYTQDEIYFIETNLYDVKSEKLVWSVQSKTYNPSSITQFAQDFTIAITRQLIKSHVIEPAVK